MRLVLLLALAASLVFAADAGGRGVAEPPAELFVFPFNATLGAQAETDVDLSLPATSALTLASVSEQAPSGVDVRLDAPPGLSLGTATVFVAGDPAPVSANLVAADPATFASDPCAPGAHAAVWTAGSLTVFLDPDPTGATTLRFCPPPTGGRVVDVDLDLLGAITNPATAGVRTWRAFMTPTTGAPFELRSLVALPQSLRLRASYATATNAIRLRGTLTAAGSSRSGINVHLAVATRVDLADARELGVARTRADGSYALTRPFARRRDAQHLTLIAYVNFYVGACADPPLVPGGCAEQSVAPPPAELLALTVPRRASGPTG